MKNLAGNDVLIFLFRFVIRGNAISFVLNESIAEDMYPDIEAQMQPLAHACCETLMRYKELCPSDTIMDGNILLDNCFEVMLSQGLGRHFNESEKQNLFNDAHEISELLIEVMDRRSEEAEQGIDSELKPLTPKIQRTEATNTGLEALGKRKQIKDELLNHISENPRLARLEPEDLPTGVVARTGYDHRGYCLAFEHETLGEIGKIVLVNLQSDLIKLEADLSKSNPEVLGEKQKLLEEIISLVEKGLRNVSEQENA